MKKFLAVVSALLVLTLCCGCSQTETNSQEKPAVTNSAKAEEAAAPEKNVSGDYEYIVLSDNTAEITGYTGSDKEIAVPAELNGLRVSSIGKIAFMETELEKIELPDTITNIGDQAFCFTPITSITIPDSVTSMGFNPFSSCTSLVEIIVSPDHPYLEIIDNVLFSKPDKRLICYPAGLCFYGENYTIPDGTEIVDTCALMDAGFETIRIPDSVKWMSKSVFSSWHDYQVIVVNHNSYAEQYCKDNNKKYKYAD